MGPATTDAELSLTYQQLLSGDDERSPGVFGLADHHEGEQPYGSLGQANHHEEEPPYGSLGLANHHEQEQPYGSFGLADHHEEEQPYGSLGLADHHEEELPYGSLGLANHHEQEPPYGSLGLADHHEGEPPYGSFGLADHHEEEQPYGSLGQANHHEQEPPYGSLGQADHHEQELPYGSLANRPEEERLFGAFGVANHHEQELSAWVHATPAEAAPSAYTHGTSVEAAPSASTHAIPAHAEPSVLTHATLAEAQQLWLQGFVTAGRPHFPGKRLLCLIFKKAANEGASEAYAGNYFLGLGDVDPSLLDLRGGDEQGQGAGVPDTVRYSHQGQEEDAASGADAGAGAGADDTVDQAAGAGGFVHEFPNWEAAQAAMNAHLRLGPANDPTFPRNAGQDRQCVERLSLAICDVSNTLDLPPGAVAAGGKVPQAYGKFAEGKYSRAQVQMVAWNVLVGQSNT